MSVKALRGLSYACFTGIWALRQFGETRPIIFGEWSSGLRHCRKNWKVPGSNPTRYLAELRDPTLL